MREILFRGKAINRPPKGTYRTNYENGDWVYGLIDCHNDYETTMRNTNGVSGIDVDPETLCEYTGLTDKNGKKIFEGDIVTIETKNNNGNINGFTGVVKFHDCGFELQSLEDKECCECLWYDSADLEIVGNIFENPELLD